MQTRNIQIIGTGKYLPKGIVTAEELDLKLGKSSGWVFKKSGVRTRHYVVDETVSDMGAEAARRALQHARLSLPQIDCIICTNSIPEQPIPCTASLIQKKLHGANSGIPCMDVNSTCLSFLAGLDMISYMVQSGRYRNILIVAPEIASVGLNEDHHESAILFGDGAAAVIIGPTPAKENSQIIASRIETYSSGSDLSEVRGGGTKFPPVHYSLATAKEYMFDMKGEALFKKTSKLLPAFINRLFESTSLSLKNMNLVIPHQGSAMAMRLLQKKLGIPSNTMMNIIENHGNTIAASLPMTLHEAVHQQRLRRGDLLAMIGISAGISLGGMIIEY